MWLHRLASFLHSETSEHERDRATSRGGNPTGPRGDGFFSKSQRCPASRPLGSIVSDRIDPELVQDVMGMLLRLDYPFEGIRPVAWGAVHDEVDALVRTDHARAR